MELQAGCRTIIGLSFGLAESEQRHRDLAYLVGVDPELDGIFATMTGDGQEAMVPVLPVDRCLAILESDDDYGGWTRRNGSLGIRLAKVDSKLVAEFVREAWTRVASK